MRLRKVTLLILILILSFTSCNSDDDDGETVVIEIRDRGEQQVDEDIIIQNYLKTHFYSLVDNDANFDYQIVQIDTIAGVNSTEVSIWDSTFLETKTVTSEDVDYTLYVLNFNEGVETEHQPTFADSTLVTYRGELFYDYNDVDGDGVPDNADVDADGDGITDIINEAFDSDGDGVDDTTVDVVRTDSDGDGIADDSDADDDGTLGTDDDKIDSDGDGIIDDKDLIDNNNLNRRVFDSAVTPVWFDQLNVIEGWRESIVGFKGASGAVENSDGTINYNMDFGNYTVFIPSGLAYFATGQVGIPAYAPLIFSIQLYNAKESDHDNDGIPSYLEDLNGDRKFTIADINDDTITHDDTDGDFLPNYFDADDDGDGVPTIDEDINGDGDPTNDIGKNGIANYLDPEETESK